MAGNLLPILAIGAGALLIMGKKKKKKKTALIDYGSEIGVQIQKTAGPSGATAGLSTWKARQESLARLTSLGICACDPGVADGKYGTNTKNAIKAFQRHAGIGVDGKWGPQTEAAMQSALAQAGGVSPGPRPSPGPSPQPAPAPTPSGMPSGMKSNEYEAANLLIGRAWEYNYDVGYMTREVYMGTHPNLNIPHEGDAGIESQIWDRIWSYIQSQSGRFQSPPKSVPVTQIKSISQLGSWLKDQNPGVLLIYLDNPHASIVPKADVVIATDQVDYSFKMLPLFASSAIENVPKHELRYAQVSLSDVPEASAVMSNTLSKGATMSDVVRNVPYVAGFFGGKWRLSKWIPYKKDALYKTNTFRHAIKSVGEKVINL